MYGMVKIVKKNMIELIEYIRKYGTFRNDDEYKDLVLNSYQNPNFFRINSYGEQYQGEIIYNINEYGSAVGFFAEFLYLLIRLYFATQRGFVPYVKWGKDFLYYEESDRKTEDNAFLYYFQPVSEVLGIENAAHVLNATKYHIHAVQDELNTHGYKISSEYMDALSGMIKKYIRYNEDTLAYLERGYERLIGDKKALAVHFRGTDYRKEYNDHPVFITIQKEIDVVKDILTRRNYDVIFLATDEQDAVDIFKCEFGSKVRVFEDTWRANAGETVHYSLSDRDNHHYLLGLEVLRDQYMLTRCNGLVCGISNVTIAARMMRKAWYDDYDDLIIISEELCHNNRNFCDEEH